MTFQHSHDLIVFLRNTDDGPDLQVSCECGEYEVSCPNASVSQFQLAKMQDDHVSSILLRPELVVFRTAMDFLKPDDSVPEEEQVARASVLHSISLGYSDFLKTPNRAFESRTRPSQRAYFLAKLISSWVGTQGATSMVMPEMRSAPTAMIEGARP